MKTRESTSKSSISRRIFETRCRPVNTRIRSGTVPISGMPMKRPDRLLPDKLAITFLTNRDGNIVSLSAPMEPMVKDVEFIRLAAGDCTLAAFRERCVGSCKSGATTHRVTLDTQGQLVLKPDNQPAYRLVPQEGRRFRIVELEGFFVEFRGEATMIDELIFHQPNGTFAAKRVDDRDRKSTRLNSSHEIPSRMPSSA